jgi:hypothetical protein
MLTVCEAMNRARMNGLNIRRLTPASVDWVVTLQEWDELTCFKHRYITDDLEDAVIEGSKMRVNAAKYL